MVLADMAVALETYLHGIAEGELHDYVAGIVQADTEEAAREAAAAEALATRPTPVYQVPMATGACGGATNGADQFIMRESGGNPNAYNPSGAWGCYQIMPGTWAGAGCDQFGAYGSAGAAAQAQCASRLPLSAWNL